MIDRNAINERFKKVFEALKAEGQIVKGNREGKSLENFAEKLGTKGHIIRRCLRSERKITPEQAELLCQHYLVRRAYLQNGSGEMFLSAAERQYLEQSNGVLLTKPTGRVFQSSAAAYASSTLDVTELETGQYYDLPGIEGSFVAFQVSGKSMEPTISEGDTVLCQALEDKRELKEGEIYAVITQQQAIMIKRVERKCDEQGNWKGLRLISDNASECPVFDIALEELRQLFLVRHKVAKVI